MIVAFTVCEIKKTKNFMKLEYISYTMTLQYKKKKYKKMADFWKKIKILLKNLMVVGLEKLYFPFNHKTGFVIELQLQQIWKM